MYCRLLVGKILLAPYVAHYCSLWLRGLVRGTLQSVSGVYVRTCCACEQRTGTLTSLFFTCFDYIVPTLGIVFSTASPKAWNTELVFDSLKCNTKAQFSIFISSDLYLYAVVIPSLPLLYCRLGSTHCYRLLLTLSHTKSKLNERYCICAELHEEQQKQRKQKTKHLCMTRPENTTV